MVAPARVLVARLHLLPRQRGALRAVSRHPLDAAVACALAAAAVARASRPIAPLLPNARRARASRQRRAVQALAIPRRHQVARARPPLAAGRAGDRAAPLLLPVAAGDLAIAPMSPIAEHAIDGAARLVVAPLHLVQIAGTRLAAVLRVRQDLAVPRPLPPAALVVAPPPLGPRRHVAIHLPRPARARLPQALGLPLRAALEASRQRELVDVSLAELLVRVGAGAPLVPRVE
mmetsp:Transcript_82288/g.251470  ORF Transcript_82288/g.251470 Transcript_82288/m.251470 type:complete len:232 (-) Transcript_82288:113-808(-)